MDSTLILSRLTDAHNHLADSLTIEQSSLPNCFDEIKTGGLCIMSSTLPSQAKLSELAKITPPNSTTQSITPCFGLHPWWTHQVSISEICLDKESHYLEVFETTGADLAPYLPHLPHPIPLFQFIEKLEINLTAYPPSILGEVGLDRSMHCPSPLQLETRNREEQLVSNCGCKKEVDEPVEVGKIKLKVLKPSIRHQLLILEAQIEIAIRLKKNISFHCVKAADEVVKLFQKKKSSWQHLKVCLHSFGGSAETAARLQRENSNLYFSFSSIISTRSPKFDSIVAVIRPDRILLETDHNELGQIDHLMLEIFHKVRGVRGWSEEEMLDRMEKNWNAFCEP